jgi:hypothetical protein
MSFWTHFCIERPRPAKYRSGAVGRKTSAALALAHQYGIARVKASRRLKSGRGLHLRRQAR